MVENISIFWSHRDVIDRSSKLAKFQRIKNLKRISKKTWNLTSNKSDSMNFGYGIYFKVIRISQDDRIYTLWKSWYTYRYKSTVYNAGQTSIFTI